jgi:hypothetical protein
MSRRLTENEAQHILDILNEHMRRCERQMHKAKTNEERSQVTREFADTHRLIKRFLESLK